MPRRECYFWVYILSNRSHVLYIGVTNGIRRRVLQHRMQTPGTFTARYKITRLVYFESFQYVNNAIAREKELKHWTRIRRSPSSNRNPTWEELLPDAPATAPPNADSLRNDKV